MASRSSWCHGKHQCYSTSTTPLPIPSHYTYFCLLIENCAGPVGLHVRWSQEDYVYSEKVNLSIRSHLSSPSSLHDNRIDVWEKTLDKIKWRWNHVRKQTKHLASFRVMMRWYTDLPSLWREAWDGGNDHAGRGHRAANRQTLTTTLHSISSG